MLHLLADATQQVTTQSGIDAWLGRLSIVVATLVGMGVLLSRARKSMHANISDIVDQRVARVETALTIHTDAEASIVRTEIELALRKALDPMRDLQNQLVGRIDGFSEMRKDYISQVGSTMTELSERVGRLEHSS